MLKAILNNLGNVLITGGAINGTIIGNKTPSTGAFTTVTATSTIVATTTVRTGGFTVSTLPAGITGAMAYVTDATTPTYNAALVGGGTVTIPVFYNGTAWVSA